MAIGKGIHRLAEQPGFGPRKCLKCGELFPSTGPGNRVCSPCSFENRRNVNRTVQPTSAIKGSKGVQG